MIVDDNFKDKNITIPKRSTSKSAGYDLASCEKLIIKPHQIVAAPTGLKAIMNDDEFLMMVPRSSLAKKHGLRLANTIGIIDADYANNPTNGGHIHIVLYNFSEQEQIVEAGERLVQGIFLKYLKTDEDDVTSARTGGFGSTGD